MPLDYSKWDNIDSGSDEDTATKKIHAKAVSSSKSADVSEPIDAVSGVPIYESDKKPLDDAPPLVHPISTELENYFLNNMTLAQRMSIMVQFWNCTEDNEERVVYLKHLIVILDDVKVSNRIKGGQEILRDLPDRFYEGVTVVKHWVETFTAMSIDERTDLLGRFFLIMPTEEQELVLAPLV